MPSTFDFGVYDTDVYGSLPVTRVRELPPLRQHLEAITPSGRHYRWGEDEPDPANVPSGLTHSSTMPGGYESLDVTLPRKPGIDYADLETLTTINVWGAGGNKCGEYRLERAPSTSGDQMSVRPGAVGWQAHLEDNKNASAIIIDRDLSHWGAMSNQRRLDLIGASYGPQDSAAASNTSALPALVTGVTGAWSATSRAIVEATYDAGAGNLLGRLRANWTRGGNVDNTDVNWNWDALLSANDVTTGAASTGSLRAAGPGSTDHVPGAVLARYAMLRAFYNAGPGGGDNVPYEIIWTSVRVIGDHEITLQGDPLDEFATNGVYASDVVTYVVGRFAPLLTTSTATVLPSSFTIPHLAFRESTTAGEMIRQSTRFGFQDWAVWDDKTFWWHDRGAFGRQWRARISPAQLEETGPQFDRLWESIVVQYNDVDGSVRTVGPVGSNADTEDASLTDSDPENPATVLGITRRDKLVMAVGTAATAIEIGRRFLEESKALDKSGRARLVGHVMDNRGVLHPYFDVRAGDTISFVDASDTSERRIVRAEHDRATRTCSVDLDAPPEGLTALLERLAVSLVPLVGV